MQTAADRKLIINQSLHALTLNELVEEAQEYPTHCLRVHPEYLDKDVTIELLARASMKGRGRWKERQKLFRVCNDFYCINPAHYAPMVVGKRYYKEARAWFETALGIEILEEVRKAEGQESWWTTAYMTVYRLEKDIHDYVADVPYIDGLSNSSVCDLIVEYLTKKQSIVGMDVWLADQVLAARNRKMKKVEKGFKEAMERVKNSNEGQ